MVSVLFILALCSLTAVMSNQEHENTYLPTKKNKLLRNGRNRRRLSHHHRKSRRLTVTTAAAQQQSQTPLPFWLDSHLADLDKADLNDYTPFFFHIPKAGGTSMKEITSSCLNLVVACQIGVTDGHAHDEHLMIVDHFHGRRYVNVDTSSKEGIEHAKELGFADRNLADVVFSDIFPLTVGNLFTKTHRGMLFTIFRHPIERANSFFYYAADADWEPTYNPNLKTMTVEQYSKSGLMENNWMVRKLVGLPDNVPVTEENLQLAKSIVSKKCLIGLMSDMETSLKRFGKFFQWNNMDDFNCIEQQLKSPPNKHPHP